MKNDGLIDILSLEAISVRSMTIKLAFMSWGFAVLLIYIKPNDVVGIRNRITIANPRLWQKVHLYYRRAVVYFFPIQLLFLFFPIPIIGLWVSVFLLSVPLIASSLYSYIIYGKSKAHEYF